MALGDPYITVDQLKEHVNQPTGAEDTSYLTALIASVSRWVEEYTGRQFNDTGAATERSYRPVSRHRIAVEDFHTTTGLVVAVDGTTLTSDDYTLEPLNGLRGGRSWPYESILTDRYLNTGTLQPKITVTARWGWASVPSDVTQATLMQCARVFQRRYSPAGLTGQGEFVFRVSLRTDPDVEDALKPFVKPQVA